MIKHLRIKMVTITMQEIVAIIIHALRVNTPHRAVADRLVDSHREVTEKVEAKALEQMVPGMEVHREVMPEEEALQAVVEIHKGAVIKKPLTMKASLLLKDLV
jgi:hypothetical protein